MNSSLSVWEPLEQLIWRDVLIIAAVLLLAHLLIRATRWGIRRAAENAPPDRRLALLRIQPFVRLMIQAAAIVGVVPILVEPTVPNVLALSAGLGLALAYTLKDYGSSLAAGLITVLSKSYQPGDWIEIDGAYGEVKSMVGWAVHLVTAADVEVIVPHSRMWTKAILNASRGNPGLLCAANFYLHPDHDAAAVREALRQMAVSSSYRAPESPVTVFVQETPWGTHYKVNAYVAESRKQFLFITDLTMRGKETLRGMRMRPAQALYAEVGPAR
jgi:small conductance mechanosensitive channel